MATKGKSEDLNNGSTPAQGCSESAQVQNGQKTKVLADPATSQQCVINTTSQAVAGGADSAVDFADSKNNEAQQLSDQEEEEEVSDDEDSAIMMRMESEISLPRAPVKQLIMDKLPKSARIHQQSKELISNLCMHFLMHIAEESNGFCNAQNKKTVCPDHVLDALIKMNLTRYLPKLAGQEELKPTGKPPRKGSKAAAKAAAAAKKEDAPEDFTKLRNAILKRLSQSMDVGSKMRGIGRGRGNKDENRDDGLTDEQKNFEQERLFREAREQFDQQQAAAAETIVPVFPPNANGIGNGTGVVPSSDQGAAAGGDQMMFEQHVAIPEDAHMVEESVLAVFNPTDFFRDTIYSTDFFGSGVLATDQMPPHITPDIAGDQPGEIVQSQQQVPLPSDQPPVEPSGFYEFENGDDDQAGFTFDEEELADLKKLQAQAIEQPKQQSLAPLANTLLTQSLNGGDGGTTQQADQQRKETTGDEQNEDQDMAEEESKTKK